MRYSLRNVLERAPIRYRRAMSGDVHLGPVHLGQAPEIVDLLEILGYPRFVEQVRARLQRIDGHPDNALWAASTRRELVGIAGWADAVAPPNRRASQN
jgi:hypothetical protein